MNESISRYGPEMEKFLFGMMQNGGRQQADQLISDMQRRGEMQDQQTRAQVMSSGMPMGTGMSRAMSGQLAQNALNRNMQIGQMEQQLMENAMARQFQGAQGLGQMPSYYGQPSSVEMAMLGAQRPYDLANLEAQMQGNQLASQLAQFNAGQQNQMQMTDQQILDQLMQTVGTYQPERLVGPSQFEQLWGPLIEGTLSGAASIGSMAMLAGSDRRFKKDIKYVDDPMFEQKVGVKRAIFRWKENDELAAGVIAQDLQEAHPELVHEDDAGYLLVDYQGVFNLAFG